MRYGGVSVAKKMCLYDVMSSQWIMIIIWSEQRAWRIKFEAVYVDAGFLSERDGLRLLVNDKEARSLVPGLSP